ncbi:MAG: hypothetical protein HYZ51_00840 [Candidatus Doudnabacteria bacterium]|nr:hypothetical protein [Candidatus Doudnabacteria bacterium]
MKLEFYNCPSAKELNPSVLPKDVEFFSYRPDFRLIEDFAKAYKQYKNVLVIGNGGSINPFIGFYYPLKHQANKEAYILNTQDRQKQSLKGSRGKVKY